MDLYPKNSTPHEEDNKVSTHIRDYKQVGAYYFQTDGSQMYRGSVRDVFWHVNDDAIKLYLSGAQLHGLTIWKARNNAIIQMGWKPRNVSDVSVSKLRIIHNRWIKPDAYVSSAILGASPLYGDPKEIDVQRTMQVKIDDVVCEGICAALMTIAPMQNFDLVISNIHFEMLHNDTEQRLGRSVVDMDAGEGMDNYTPGQGNSTLGIHIKNWTIGEVEVDKKNAGEDRLGQLKNNPMFDGNWSIE
ncbi:dextranase [Fusarium agapanthi]|uniref:Dextranase n=1 Tax=Fusarium agapanthi TaxID=1803897 RepID=A0A9P5BG14_9HYPO|nr:dextranase [Fusarium agapanthi]